MQLLDDAALKPIEIGADRRQHERYAFSAPVELSWCEADNTQRSVIGLSVDVSMYGMLVETFASLVPGTKLAVAMGGVEISSKARVCHCRSVQDFFRVGLRFDTTLIAEHLANLDSVLIKSLRVAVSEIEQVQPPVEQVQPPRDTKWWSKVLRREHRSTIGGLGAKL
jgi:hypothetical protein